MAHLEIGRLTPYLPPADTQILVVEDEGQIVGVWAATKVVHLEGVWIAPAHQGHGSVARRLLRGIWTIARQWGAVVCWTGAHKPEVASLITKLHGVRVPCDVFLVPVPQDAGSGVQPCQPLL